MKRIEGEAKKKVDEGMQDEQLTIEGERLKKEDVLTICFSAAKPHEPL